MRKIGGNRKWKKRYETPDSLEQKEDVLYGALGRETISSMEIMEMMDVERM